MDRTAGGNIHSESIDLCRDIESTCVLLEKALDEKKYMKVAALNKLLRGLARRLRDSLDDSSRA